MFPERFEVAFEAPARRAEVALFVCQVLVMVADLVAPFGHRPCGFGIERRRPEVVRRRDVPMGFERRHPSRVRRSTIDIVAKHDEPIGQVVRAQVLTYRKERIPRGERGVEKALVRLESVIEYVHVKSIGK
ncbi:hypothetical protein BRC68_05170 [Halobacteriales archaeon QH_6_64_20]|nr:MAG: hypothetical protein BRC68_05170 [Halobacteriales archaeon QH_6_64_20]